MPRAIVIGGGIAGLASAASLLRTGWAVTVLERTSEFTDVGAGLAITRNGMTALDTMGIGDAVRRDGWMVQAAGFQDRRGRWVVRIPDVALDRDRGTWVCAVHRQRLHAALLRAAADAELVTDARVTGVRTGFPSGEPAAVAWLGRDGEHESEADLVVAADGVRSTSRAQLFPHVQPRYGGSTSWRAVIADTTLVDDRFIAVWGPGAEFGALRISDTEVYWYGYFRHPEGGAFDDELAAAQEKFAGWPARIRDIVAATHRHQLMRHDVYHVPGGLPTYVQGRVAFAGDAAHAFLPTVGQGAATSLEDGVCIGRLAPASAAENHRLGIALRGYDRARRPRCRRIARQALMIARIGPDVAGNFTQAMRNTLLRLTPSRLLAKAGTAQLVSWTPPAPPPDVSERA